MSRGGKNFLESNGITCTYDLLTDNIINREGTGICPMEKTVADIDDADAGYAALKKKLAELSFGIRG